MKILYVTITSQKSKIIPGSLNKPNFSFQLCGRNLAVTQIQRN